MVAVELNHITVAYNDQVVVHDLSAVVPAGAMLAVVGPNGAGKTTLLQTMLGLVAPVHGSVTFFGGTLDQHRHRIAYVPQRMSVDWDFPAQVLDVVLMGCYKKLGWFAHPDSAQRAQALHALEQVGMETYAMRSIGQLSGGQQQRVFLARALMQEADIYFLDEPCAGIDAPTEKSIIDLLKRLSAQGKTIIIVHHDLQTLHAYFNALLLINKTSIFCGPLSLATQHHFISAYGKENPFLSDARVAYD
ncbi:ABC transporter ATP-binding protein [Candidatus Dependentiae bacterium]|nr:ABC transporter ATP-binding protein [Candidatus Dependentiae bacterium]MCC7414693.1 ABC transporter ATP-binding protein [Campylobacterota bacterium]